MRGAPFLLGCQVKQSCGSQFCYKAQGLKQLWRAQKQKETAFNLKQRTLVVFVLGSCSVVGRVSWLHCSLGLLPKGRGG